MMFLLRVSAAFLFLSSYAFAQPYAPIAKAVEGFREKHREMRGVLSKMSTQFFVVGKNAKAMRFPLTAFKKSDQGNPHYPNGEPVLPGFVGFTGLLIAHRALFENLAIIESNPGQRIPAEVEMMIKEDLAAVRKLLPPKTHVFLVQTPFVMNPRGTFTLLQNSRMIESEQNRYLEGKKERQSIRGLALSFIPKSYRYDALVLGIAKSPPERPKTALMHDVELAYYQHNGRWREVAFSPEELGRFMADAMQKIEDMQCLLEHYTKLMAKGFLWPVRKITRDDMKNAPCGGSAGDTEPYSGRRYADEDDEEDNSPYHSTYHSTYDQNRSFGTGSLRRRFKKD